MWRSSASAASRPLAAASGPMPAWSVDSAATVVAGPALWDRAQAQMQRRGRQSATRLAECVRLQMTPDIADLMVLTRFFESRGGASSFRQSLAVDVVQILAQRQFPIHSPLYDAYTELHVRLFYQAVRSLRADGLFAWTFASQRQLVEHVRHLRVYGGNGAAPGAMPNPTTLYYLSCLRNVLCANPNDESSLSAALRYGFGPMQVAAGIVTHQGGTAAAGLWQLGRELQNARLKPSNWYARIQRIEACSERVFEAVRRGVCAQAACQALLQTSEETLRDELVRLRGFSSGIKSRLRDAFNRADVRQVDNEWDVAFACLEHLHLHLVALQHPESMQPLCNQLRWVIASQPCAALRYKALEIVRDLRFEKPLRPLGDVLLHLASDGHSAVAAAVQHKRQAQAQIHRELHNAQREPWQQQGWREPRVLAPWVGLGDDGALTLRRSPSLGSGPLPPPQPNGAAAPTAWVKTLRLSLEPAQAGTVLARAIVANRFDTIDALLRIGVCARDGEPVHRTADAAADPAWPKVGPLALAVWAGSAHAIEVLCTPRASRRGMRGPQSVAQARRTPPKAGADDVRPVMERALVLHP